MSQLVLSLFPGIGLLDMAFEQEGFCVVRGPDLLWGGDIKNFHPPAGKFDGVIGGPPCQAFSSLQRLLEHQRRRGRNYRRAENLIPEFERCVHAARPQWFVMENVPAAPVPEVRIEGYCISPVVLNNRWLGAEQRRTRRFTFGAFYRVAEKFAPAVSAQCVVLEAFRSVPAVTASSGGREPRMSAGGKLKKRYATGGELYKYRSITEALVAQGLATDFFAQSPFTVEGQRGMLGRGVPLPMGRAIARAVRQALGLPLVERAELPA